MVMKGFVLDYINENEYHKLERALKKYNMLAFKKLNFEYYPALRDGNFVGKLVSQNKKEGTINYTTLECVINDLDHINPDLTKDIREAFKKALDTVQNEFDKL